MKKTKIFLLHFGYWFFYALIGVLVISLMMSLLYMEQRITKFSPQEISIMRQVKVISFVSYYVPALLSYLIAYFLIFKKGMQNNWKLMFYSLGTIAFGVLINFIIVYFIHNSFPFVDPEAISVLVGLLLFVTVIVALLSTIMGIIIKGFVNWFSEVKEKELLAKKNHEMELALVKSQLDPHFLFNSINNIDVLIHKDAEKASLFLNKLSDIMRFMLFETKQDKIELSKELAYVGKYVDLQKIRSSNPDYVKVDFHIEDEQVLVAPMIFIPFIENAFKYSETYKSENAVQIEIKSTATSLRFICNNKYSKNQSNSIGGLGNDLIQKRLSLLYPSHQLSIKEQDELFQVILEIEF